MAIRVPGKELEFQATGWPTATHTRLSPPHLPSMYKTHPALDWDSLSITPNTQN